MPIILRKLYADLLMTPGFSWTRFQISIISPSVIPCPRNHALFMTSTGERVQKRLFGLLGLGFLLGLCLGFLEADV